MTAKLWARNPHNYIRECLEAGLHNFVWNKGMLTKRNIDPYKFSQLYCGVNSNWSSLIISDDWAIEIDKDHPESNPLNTYPVWDYGDDWDWLVALVVSGSHKLIVITGVKGTRVPIVKRFLRSLKELQEENPDVGFHLHGVYSYFALFGLDFKSVDFDGRNAAAMGELMLPTGKKIKQQYCSTEQMWVHLLGFKPVDLKIPRNRCIFNIKSHMWASQFYTSTPNFKSSRCIFEDIDIESTKIILPTKRNITPFTLGKNHIKLESDKFLCNLCSLQSRCTYFREGSVCIVPGSEPTELAKFFQTRDSDTIIEGLGNLLAAQSHRLQDALRTEEEKNELHPETRKIINDLFDRGVKLAKLVNPALAAAGAPKFNLNQTAGTIIQGTPQQLMSSILEEFERRGIPRADVTPEMIMRVINQPESLKAKAIEVAIDERATDV